MRKITLIIIHCSATPRGRNTDFETYRHDHIHHRGFRDIGYHFYITRDGGIHRGLLEWIGAHARTTTILSASVMKGPVCWRHTRGTHDTGNRKWPCHSVRALRAGPPEAIIVRHHGFESAEGCPCFDAVKEYGGCENSLLLQLCFYQTNKPRHSRYISCISSSIARYTVVFPTSYPRIDSNFIIQLFSNRASII